MQPRKIKVNQEHSRKFWLSILIPVFNVEGYLQECVDSIVSQIEDGVEIVLLDDCSTDSSSLVMQRLHDKYPSIIKLASHDKNRGLSAARNSMIALARGRYIWFVDSDDILNPGAIHSLKRTIDCHDADLVICDFKIWRSNQKLKHILRGENHRKSFHGVANSVLKIRSEIIVGAFASGNLHAWSKIAKKSLWGDDIRFPEGRYFEDMETISRLLLKSSRCVYVNEPWVSYRQREGSILATMSFKKVHDLSRALNAFSRDLAVTLGQDNRRLQDDPSLAFAISHLSARNYMAAMRFLAAHPELEHAADAARAFARHYRHSSPLTPEELLQAYWRRGWWARYFRARRWLRHVPTLQESIA